MLTTLLVKSYKRRKILKASRSLKGGSLVSSPVSTPVATMAVIPVIPVSLINPVSLVIPASLVIPVSPASRL